MKFRIGPDGPLGLIVLLVSAPIIFALVLLFWSDEIDFIRRPSAYPGLLLWHQGKVAVIVSVGLIFSISILLRRLSGRPREKEGDTEQRYSEGDDI